MRALPVPQGDLLRAWNPSPTEHNILAAISGELFLQHFALGNRGRWWLKVLTPIPESVASAIVDFYGGSDHE